MKIKLLISLVLLVSQAYSQVADSSAVQADFTTKPALLWKFKTNGPVVASPVIENGSVFVGSLNSTLYAHDLTT